MQGLVSKVGIPSQVSHKPSSKNPLSLLALTGGTKLSFYRFLFNKELGMLSRVSRQYATNVNAEFEKRDKDLFSRLTQLALHPSIINNQMAVSAEEKIKFPDSKAVDAVVKLPKITIKQRITQLCQLMEKPLLAHLQSELGNLQAILARNQIPNAISELAISLLAQPVLWQPWRNQLRDVLLSLRKVLNDCLVVSFQQNNIDAVMRFVNIGADPNVIIKDNRTLLMCVSAVGDDYLVTFLLERNVNINIISKEGLSALSLAFQYGHMNIVHLLLAHGADVTPALEYDSKEGDTRLIKFLLKEYKDVINLFVVDKCLKKASQFGKIEIIQFFLQLKYPILPEYLILAATNNHLNVLYLFTDYGAQINVESVSTTPLIAAATNGHDEVVSFLLENKAEVDAVDKDGGTALLHASKQNRLRVVSLLLKYRADVNKATNEGETPLMAAAKEGNNEVAQLLLRKQARINAVDINGMTALMYASEREYLYVVTSILKFNKDVNIADNKHETALMKVAGCTRTPEHYYCCHSDIAKLLIQSRADINSTNKEEKTVLSKALVGNNKELIKMLQDAGAKKTPSCVIM